MRRVCKLGDVVCVNLELVLPCEISLLPKYVGSSPAILADLKKIDHLSLSPQSITTMKLTVDLIINSEKNEFACCDMQLHQSRSYDMNK